MSTTKQKYILGLSKDLVIHFAQAADGSDSVALSPITEASFGEPETALLTFDSAPLAEKFKDRLCRIAIELETFESDSEEIVPHTLQTYVDLEVMAYEPELAIA